MSASFLPNIHIRGRVTSIGEDQKVEPVRVLPPNIVFSRCNGGGDMAKARLSGLEATATIMSYSNHCIRPVTAGDMVDATNLVVTMLGGCAMEKFIQLFV
jgi:hypothetical protein